MSTDRAPPVKKPITIVDVARLTGVSIKTVSRVMNREPGVGEVTRARIEKAIEELGYRPNASARALSSHRSYLIGMIVYTVGHHDYIGELHAGALEACRRAGYHLALEPAHFSSTMDANELASRAAEYIYDGIIVAPPMSDDLELMRVLIDKKIPLVRISPGVELDLTPQVFTDDFQAAYDMTALLCAQGHSRIAFIEGPPEHLSGARRLEGHLQALKDHNIQPRAEWRIKGDFLNISGLEAMDAFLHMTPRPTAVFAANDLMALGALAACAKFGVKCPEEISVVGFDDIVGASQCWPPLTTVHQPVAKLGELAANLLIAGIGDPRYRTRTESDSAPCHIVERSSLAAPSATA
jgi:LacI family transcriptional regulator